MENNIGGRILYSLLIADNQVVISDDNGDTKYMTRKLKEQYEKWGLDINL